jgi:hypothetical protein
MSVSEQKDRPTATPKRVKAWWWPPGVSFFAATPEAVAKRHHISVLTSNGAGAAVPAYLDLTRYLDVVPAYYLCRVEGGAPALDADGELSWEPASAFFAGNAAAQKSAGQYVRVPVGDKFLMARKAKDLVSAVAGAGKFGGV